ncbi:hypothetical protein [Ectobacillus ponti]|uniref:Amino acid ABC transporter substrate-binding protein n=1 Tax=Ectobacillus ponti TaxID=2961894 RepID=A0AA41X7K8_9BACI|nr:hypothetical protein [Ectobacillus ponti]MCP8968119.1 hypothetical protein [Ectobacillus ponti]
MKKTSQLLMAGIALAGMTGMMAGCSSKEKAASTTTKEKVILVGTQNDYPPFAFADEKIT